MSEAKDLGIKVEVCGQAIDARTLALVCPEFLPTLVSGTREAPVPGVASVAFTETLCGRPPLYLTEEEVTDLVHTAGAFMAGPILDAVPKYMRPALCGLAPHAEGAGVRVAARMFKTVASVITLSGVAFAQMCDVLVSVLDDAFSVGDTVELVESLGLRVRSERCGCGICANIAAMDESPSEAEADTGDFYVETQRFPAIGADMALLCAVLEFLHCSASLGPEGANRLAAKLLSLRTNSQRGFDVAMTALVASAVSARGGLGATCACTILVRQRLVDLAGYILWAITAGTRGGDPRDAISSTDANTTILPLMHEAGRAIAVLVPPKTLTSSELRWAQTRITMAVESDGEDTKWSLVFKSLPGMWESHRVKIGVVDKYDFVYADWRSVERKTSNIQDVIPDEVVWECADLMSGDVHGVAEFKQSDRLAGRVVVIELNVREETDSDMESVSSGDSSGDETERDRDGSGGEGPSADAWRRGGLPPRMQIAARGRGVDAVFAGDSDVDMD